MTVKTIYVACPAGFHSGGPTLLHQLCAALIQNGIDSRMLYFKARKRPLEIHPNYQKLNLPTTFRASDNSNSTIIVPETKTSLLSQYKNVKKIVWWLSVDNFFSSWDNPFFLINKALALLNLGNGLGFNLARLRHYGHLSQSQYATEFLCAHGLISKSLGDYLTADFLADSQQPTQSNRLNRVAFNPAKGYRFTKKIIQALPNIDFFSISGLSSSEVMKALKTSKVYIDFGNHPGKDRLPREAAACGCCIITGKKGSASNNMDIPIPAKYKFDQNMGNLTKIDTLINCCFENYSEHAVDFENYRKAIFSEPEIFFSQVRNLFVLGN